MKLLQLNVTANWGSTGKIAEGIGRAAMARGWESYIAYGRYMNPSQSQLIKVGNKFGVYAHYARNRFLDGEGLGSRKATKELIRNIKDLSPDIIHLHNIHDHWLNYPLLFDFFTTIDTPIIWTFHDCWAFTGGCMYFEVPPCDKWKTNCDKCPLRDNQIDKSHKQFETRKKLFIPLCNRITIVPVSNWLRSFCCESFLKVANIEMIHNGIDTAVFSNCHPKSMKPQILGVANVWDSRKGLNDIKRLRSLIPEEKADIVLVGLSDKQISELPSGILGITRTQDISELVKLYSQSSVFVNPTYADNFPTVNLESLACGTPVVTYRTGGSPEAVDDLTGLVVERGDVKGMADAIIRVIDNPDKYSTDNCRRRAVENFNKDIQFIKYVDMYENLCTIENFKN